MQPCYIVDYNSEANFFRGKIVVFADSVSEAQTKFFDWLKKQPTYEHMWKLEISIEGDITYLG
jgi:hypothetical protein